MLDLTRVIAGPVGTRMLGALGADVLRIDPPGRPELELHQWDGLLASVKHLSCAQRIRDRGMVRLG